MHFWWANPSRPALGRATYPACVDVPASTWLFCYYTNAVSLSRPNVHFPALLSLNRNKIKQKPHNIERHSLTVPAVRADPVGDHRFCLSKEQTLSWHSDVSATSSATSSDGRDMYAFLFLLYLRFRQDPSNPWKGSYYRPLVSVTCSFSIEGGKTCSETLLALTPARRRNFLSELAFAVNEEVNEN